MTTLRELITELETIAATEDGDNLLVKICDIDGEIFPGPVWANRGETPRGHFQSPPFHQLHTEGDTHVCYIDFSSDGAAEEIHPR
jgi:hypothetical protein